MYVGIFSVHGYKTVRYKHAQRSLSVSECVSESFAPRVTPKPFTCDPVRGIESIGCIVLVTGIKDDTMAEDYACV